MNKKSRNKKIRYSKPIKLVRNLLSDKRALSVVLSTMIITAGVIAGGIAVLYWAYGWGNLANNQYASTITNNQNSIEQNLAFEYISYSNGSNSLTGNLTVYVINNGLGNVSLSRLYIWNSTNALLTTQPISAMYNITSNLPLSTSPSYATTLSPGEEGYFNITGLDLTQVVGSPAFYSIRVVTSSGMNFDGSFSY